MKEIQSIVILGSGNVATHLGLAFHQAGIKIIQVFSRNLSHAEELARIINAHAISDIDRINLDTDLILFCISDSAVLSVLKQRNWENALLVHTAGTIAIDVFQPFANNYGVLYPYQTFTKNRKLNISEVPFLIEGNTRENDELLKDLTSKISSHIHIFHSPERSMLHLAGVFANNFSNHMFLIAKEILSKAGLPDHLIYPLIEETSRKAIETGPFNSQTGPALRHNIDIMNKHIEMLASNPDWQKIYTFVSESISKFHNIDGEL
jgi:predicted short-subunit dehydrogenase-like oxidoreductase (DUF2520 family)